MFISNHSIFSIQHLWGEGCPHHWMWSYSLQTWRCYSSPVCQSMMSGNLHMGTDMGIIHVVRNVHEYIEVCQGFHPNSNVHPWVVQFGNPLPYLFVLCLGWSICLRGKVFIEEHLSDTALMVFSLGVEAHLQGCHHHLLQKSWKSGICILVWGVFLWHLHCVVLLDHG